MSATFDQLYAVQAAASADDVPALADELEQLRRQVTEQKALLDHWADLEQHICSFIPEHYEAGYDSIRDWTAHAYRVVEIADLWRKASEPNGWTPKLAAAVEKIYPSEDYA
jgi:hypothetical protein